MLVTLFGMVTLVRFVQFSHNLPTLVTPSAITTLFIVPYESGNIEESRCEQTY